MLPLTELVFFLNKWDFTVHRRKWESGVKVLMTRDRNLPRSDQLLCSERGFSIDKSLMILSVVRKFCEVLTQEVNLKGEYFSLDFIIMEKHGKRSSWKIIIQRANRRLQVDYWKFRRKSGDKCVRLCLLSSLTHKTSLSCLYHAFIFLGEKLPYLYHPSSATCSKVYLALWTLPLGSPDRTGIHTGSCCLKQHQCGCKETGGWWWRAVEKG